MFTCSCLQCLYNFWNHIFLIIQSFWRGRRARLDNPQLQVVRDRLFKATKNAMKTKILYNRTQVALENLFKYKHLSCILEALMNLGQVICPFVFYLCKVQLKWAEFSIYIASKMPICANALEIGAL